MTTIAFNPGISNADVSRRTGLAPQTASAIVTELEDDGLIKRGEVLRGRRGQPATPLFLKFEAAYSIGCHVTWQRLELVLIDLSAQPIARHRRDYAYPDARTIVADMVEGVNELLSHLDDRQRERLIGIGVASPTNIGNKIGMLDAPPEQAELWQSVDLAGGLEAATGIPSIWSSHGSAACWAELVMGPAPRPENFAYLYVDTLLGAGIIAEHTLWEGPTGNSANLGSMLICRGDGKLDFAHNLASTISLDRRLAEAGITRPLACSSQWPWEEWEPVVGPWLEQSGNALAQVVVNTAAVIESNLTVIDGTLPRPILERLLAETRRALDGQPVLAGEPPQINAGRLGYDAMPLGASFMPIFRKYFSRDLRGMASWETAPITW